MLTACPLRPSPTHARCGDPSRRNGSSRRGQRRRRGGPEAHDWGGAEGDHRGIADERAAAEPQAGPPRNLGEAPPVSPPLIGEVGEEREAAEGGLANRADVTAT